MRSFAAILVLLLSSMVPTLAVEIKEDGWKFPNPAAAEKMAAKTTDTTSRIPGKEVSAKAYRKEKGVGYMTFEIEGIIFACQFHIKGEGRSPVTVYSIVDNDGDGVFESKYGPGEMPKTPEWVIQRYFERHPDMKDPGPESETIRK